MPNNNPEICEALASFNVATFEAMCLWARVDYVLSDVLESYRSTPRLLHCEQDVLTFAKPIRFEKVLNSNELLFGIELEFLAPYVDYVGLAPLLNIGVFKSEGSVDRGAEFVTLPYSHTQLRDLLKKLSKPITKMLSKNCEDVNNECGMHIHVSRKGLSGLEIARILYLLNYNSPASKAYWEQQAGRPSNEYCEYTKLSGVLKAAVKSGEEPDNGWVATFGNIRFRKYRLLNINPNDTIEFRMFKSPDNADKVIENLNLVASIISYSKAGGYTLRGFKKFLRCDTM